MQSVIVIPARWASTRFPGKPLAPIAGVSLIQRVYERATKSQRAAAVYVATDDQRIFEHVLAFGGNVVRPEGDFATGTDRIAAAMPLIGEAFDVVVNVQGDEPLIDIGEVDRCIARVDRADIATLACPLETEEEFLARDVVKVVVGEDGNALFFSRAPIGSRDVALRHIGVYAYRREAIERFVSLPQSPLERAESLEQLRALHHGFKIAVSQTPKPHLGVDRPEDVARVESELAKLH
ncbi:MAG TPA: 3-deoxy-manno-octulosonate cytidylyltransferase [Thermoanaerobaculia bacterium]|nr:3-deoxy-manno-octulosonate cytidylyltransferase [Thermoanaerobaculia bacterium]